MEQESVAVYVNSLISLLLANRLKIRETKALDILFKEPNNYRNFHNLFIKKQISQLISKNCKKTKENKPVLNYNHNFIFYATIFCKKIDTIYLSKINLLFTLH